MSGSLEVRVLNIYVRSHRAGDRVMSSVCRFVTTQLRLKVNVSKNAVARPEERKFLGFRITNDGRQRQIAPQALDRFKMRIRELTRRKLGVSLPQLVEQLAPYLVGWRGYFGFCDAPRVLANLDAWIRRRLRMYLWRQWQSGRHRFQELRRRGVSQFHAAVAAGRRVTDRVLADVPPPGRPARLAQSLFRLGRPSETRCVFGVDLHRSPGRRVPGPSAVRAAPLAASHAGEHDDYRAWCNEHLPQWLDYLSQRRPESAAVADALPGVLRRACGVAHPCMVCATPPPAEVEDGAVARY